METPEFYQTNYYNSQFTTADNNPKNGVDAFIIEDLLDFPIDDGMVDAGDDCGGLEAALTGGTSTVSSPAATAPTADNSCNSSFSTAEPYLQTTAHGFADDHFSNELCVPYDDLAELEWLSNFVDESFSSEDLQKMQLIQGMKAARTTNDSSETHQYQFQPPEAAHPAPLIPTEMSVPAKARSKRPRAAPGNWTSRLLAVSTSPPAAFISAPAMSSSSESDVVKKSGKPAAVGQQKKKESSDSSGSGGGEGRRCVHCATDKTPQWRTGPMGPKTLCNACGVRYKSGRLVPEYRPASSPTFVMTKHSNSHRKVMELRRQKEMVRAQQNQQQQFMHHHQNMMFDVSNGDDYLIHQHIGPDYRQII